jgi:hypothetical protein
MVRAGDRVIVEQDLPALNGRFEAHALGSGFPGERVFVRLYAVAQADATSGGAALISRVDEQGTRQPGKQGGPVISVEVVGRGRVRWREGQQNRSAAGSPSEEYGGAN